MERIVGVRFKEAGRMYYFNPGEFEICEGDGVIVETARGLEYGDVVLTPRDVPDEQIVAPLKDVLRIATDEDRETHTRNLQLEQEAFQICQEKVSSHELDMKLVDVEYTFNGSKITFFFTSEGRVDFRDLVKDLAAIFKTRIELRQIGVRDEAKMLGGLGSCGRPVCCKTFLADFQPVSIKMAKEQRLSLSPTKISGLCGRLMCCLKYEQDSYESMRKLMPRVNREVITMDGKGMVLDNNVITERTKVKLVLPDGTIDIREYHFSDVRKPGLPEEDAVQQRELVALAQERALRNRPVEEEFRFVTGATAEAPQAATPEEQQPTAKKASHRRSRGKGRTQQAGDAKKGEQAADGQKPRQQGGGQKPANNPSGKPTGNPPASPRSGRSGGKPRQTGAAKQATEGKPTAHRGNETAAPQRQPRQQASAPDAAQGKKLQRSSRGGRNRNRRSNPDAAPKTPD